MSAITQEPTVAILSLVTLIAVLAIVVWQFFSLRRHRRKTNDYTIDGSAQTTTGERVFHRAQPAGELEGELAQGDLAPGGLAPGGVAPGQDIGHR